MVHLSDLAAAMPAKPAVIMADGGRVLTYRQLDERSRQVSRLLAAHGIGPRDHIAVLMVNRPEYFEVAWGAQRRGVYWTPVNWHLTADEAGYIVRDCGAQVLFASPETAELAARLAAQRPGLRAYVAGAGTGDEATDRYGLPSLDAALEELPAGPIANETEGITFFYSSGTTGRPKGIKPNFSFPPFGTGVGLELRMQAAAVKACAATPDRRCAPPRSPSWHTSRYRLSPGSSRLSRPEKLTSVARDPLAFSGIVYFRLGNRSTSA